MENYERVHGGSPNAHIINTEVILRRSDADFGFVLHTSHTDARCLVMHPRFKFCLNLDYEFGRFSFGGFVCRPALTSTTVRKFNNSGLPASDTCLFVAYIGLRRGEEKVTSRQNTKLHIVGGTNF